MPVLKYDDSRVWSLDPMAWKGERDRYLKIDCTEWFRSSLQQRPQPADYIEEKSMSATNSRLPLKKLERSHWAEANGWSVGCWRDSLPFVANKAGKLIHRPKGVTLFNTPRGSHIAVHYYCDQGVTDNQSKGKLSFSDSIDADDMLCEACEARAVMAGFPSASEIVGRHVHIGKLKVVRCAEFTHKSAGLGVIG